MTGNGLQRKKNMLPAGYRPAATGVATGTWFSSSGQTLATRIQ